MDARQNLADGKYENKVKYHYERIPVNEETMTVKQAKAHEFNEKQKQIEQKQRHRLEDSRLANLLCEDLEIEYGIAGHAKAGKLWSLAWEHGHSGGYSEVINYYEQFVELIQS